MRVLPFFSSFPPVVTSTPKIILFGQILSNNYRRRIKIGCLVSLLSFPTTPIRLEYVVAKLLRSNYHSIILHQNQKSTFEISISCSVSILFSTFKDPTPFIYIIDCHRNKQNGRRIKFIGPTVVTSCKIHHSFPIITLDLLVWSLLEYCLVQNDIYTIIISVLQAFYTYFYVVVGMIWSTGINTS